MVLQQAKLIVKKSLRGKPTIVSYEGKYSFDMWKIEEIGIRVGQWISIKIDKDNFNKLPSLKELKVEQLAQIEDLYRKYKLLIALKKAGGFIKYKAVRKCLEIDEKMLVSYTSPTNYEKPLFAIKINSSSFKTKIFKHLKIYRDDDINIILTDEGNALSNNFS